MKSKNKILFFIIGLIIGFIAASIFRGSGPTPVPVLTEGSPDTVFVQGTPDTVYVTIVNQGIEILKPQQGSDDKTTLFEKTINVTDNNVTGWIDLDIKTYPAVDSIQLDWFMSLEAKSFESVDTIKIFRVDTLKVPFEKPRMFYDNFETGFGAAATLIAVLLLLIK